MAGPRPLWTTASPSSSRSSAHGSSRQSASSTAESSPGEPPVVYVTRRVPEEALDVLRVAGLRVRQWDRDDPVPRDTLLSEAAGARGLLPMLTERVDQELLEAAPLLQVVGNYAVGYDNVDVAACTRRGVVVCNTPGVLAETTADLVWALILAAARRLVESAELVRRGEWAPWGPLWQLGHDVHHRTLGIVGLGQIGWEVAKRALGFDMRVIYHSRTRKTELEERYGLRYVDLNTLLEESDFVTINASLTEQTRHLFSGPQFERMKPSAYLINVARGPIVDQEALYEACRDGLIAGAALDVTDPEPMSPEDPLLTLRNVTVLPHLGSATQTTRLNMGLKAARNIAAVLTGRSPESPVNPQALSA